MDRGPLMVVQALTTLSLVIALPIGVQLTHQHLDRRQFVAALGVAGLGRERRGAGTSAVELPDVHDAPVPRPS